ncbi:MAG: DUF4442 domain-containing protein [Crocinitomicaceae bacterium]|nr:DUF4442 domain-containing protein [Crocinitomicaceae bacterium]
MNHSHFNETNAQAFQKRMLNPILFRLMLYKMLPLAALTGVKLNTLDRDSVQLSVKYKFLNKNPFKTTYWAVLGMCAEMASGLLLLMYTYKLNPSVSTYVLSSDAKFIKRALGKTTFVCKQGAEIEQIIIEAIESKEPKEISCQTLAYNEQNELIAEFNFVWGVKVRTK